MKPAHRYILAGAMVLIVALVAVASGQAQRRAATLDDLTAEVRALHADLIQIANASGRMQVLVARLSLQEHASIR